MSTIEEKRMYGDQREGTVAYVASERGVATVRVSGDRVGRFGLAHRCEARDLATVDGAVVVATAEDVLVGPGEFEPLGLGPAVAVTTLDGGVLAGTPDGTVSRHADGAWSAVGAVEDVRALSGEFVAAAGGVFRVGDGLAGVGLADARDVAAGGTVLAATGDGLYRLGNGWLCEREGAFDVATTRETGPTGPGRASANAETGESAGAVADAHAADGETLYARTDGWTAVDLPVAESVVDVAYGECVYAATGPGTFLVEAAPDRTADGTGGWRPRSLGLPGISALAVA
ncbi:hypothetical protein BRC92_11235 [Halobacteriales archaeon QS_4_69_31]|nr:MAG: hypothetical protein BRC92_11235 [Halobacteriales archaeon QS_4_69_31]